MPNQIQFRLTADLHDLLTRNAVAMGHRSANALAQFLVVEWLTLKDPVSEPVVVRRGAWEMDLEAKTKANVGPADWMPPYTGGPQEIVTKLGAVDTRTGEIRREPIVPGDEGGATFAERGLYPDTLEKGRADSRGLVVGWP